MPTAPLFFHKATRAFLAQGLTAALWLAMATFPPALPAGDRPGGSRIFRDGSSPALLADAEKTAAAEGARVLAQARKMTVDNREILPGACWDYINTVYERAGYASQDRSVPFRSKKKGPYAQAAQIQAGDWLYFINHSYGNVEHSSLFVAWADKKSMRAYMLSYPGEQRRETARYLIYDLSNVYQVIRPKA